MTRKYTIGNRTIDISYIFDRFLTEIIENKEYERAVEDMVVLDLGCNIGTFSLTMYDRAEKIYAIDPSEENISCLNQTIRENNLTKIQTFKTAISGDGKDRLMVADLSPGLGGWHFKKKDETRDLITIPTMTIEDFMNQNNIPVVDLLKTDIEGAEKEMFESQAFKNVSSRIHKIIGEYHGFDPKDILEECGYLYTTQESYAGGLRFVAKKL